MPAVDLLTDLILYAKAHPHECLHTHYVIGTAVGTRIQYRLQSVYYTPVQAFLSVILTPVVVHHQYLSFGTRDGGRRGASGKPLKPQASAVTGELLEC
jgi:hypothetical protein